MKKIKYLLWLFIVWVWLLINQSFWFWNPTIEETNLYVEWVTLPWSDSNMLSSVYRYSFNNRGWGYYSRTSRLSWSRLIDWVNSDYWYSACSSNLDWYLFNNTAFWTELYNGWVTNIFWNSSCNWKDVANVTNWWYSPIKIALGNWNDFWNNFIYVNSLLNTSWVKTPHYWLWGWFLTNNDFVSLTAPNINYYLRLFFRQNWTNLSDPQNTLWFITWYLNSWSIAWQYFTQNSAIYRTKYQTSNKYIIDYWREGIKWKHFWGYWMGYSFALNVSSQINILQWWNWSFWNIGSRCVESAMNLWITDFDTLTNSACSSLWLLVLKWDSYVSRNSNASVVVLWKNPNNTKQILYEQFDCAEDDLIRIMNPWTWEDNFCNSIWHWYITYNWSSDILPFSSKQDTYTIGSWNKFLDFLFTGWLYWYIWISSSQYCLYSSSNSSFCFSLVTTPQLTSLKEMYLQNSGDIGWIWWTVTGDMLDDIVINYPSDYYTYSWLVEFAMSWINLEFDSWYLNDYLSYNTWDVYPVLNKLKFWVCPFVSDWIFPTIWMSEFSFDIMSPFKCVYYALQVWVRSNSNFVVWNILSVPIINDEFLCSFIWIVFLFWIFMIIFKFVKHF